MKAEKITPILIVAVLILAVMMTVVALGRGDTRSEWDKITQEGTEYTLEVECVCLYEEEKRITFNVSGDELEKANIKRGILGSLIPEVTYEWYTDAVEYGETWSEEILSKYLTDNCDPYLYRGLLVDGEYSERVEIEDELGHKCFVNKFDYEENDKDDWQTYYSAQVTMAVYKGKAEPLYLTIGGSKAVVFKEITEEMTKEPVTPPAPIPEAENGSEQTFEAWYLNVPYHDGAEDSFSFFISDEFVYVPPEKHLFYETQALGLSFKYKPEEMKFAEGWSFEILDEFLNGTEELPYKSNINDAETEYSLSSDVFIADLTDEHGHKYMHYMDEDAVENPEDYTAEDEDWINSYYYSSTVTVKIIDGEVVPQRIYIGGDLVAEFV